MSLLPQTQTEQSEGEIPSSYLEFKDKFIDFALRNTRDDETAFLLAVRLMAALICEKSEFVFERLHFRERFADDPGRSYDFVAFERRTLHFFVLDSKLFERDDETISLPMMDVEVRGMQTLFSHAEKAYAVTPTGQEDAHALCALILSRMSKALPTDDVDEIHVHYLALNPVSETFVEPIDNEIGNLRIRVSEWSPALVQPTIDLLTVAVVKAFASMQASQVAKQVKSVKEAAEKPETVEEAQTFSDDEYGVEDPDPDQQRDEETSKTQVHSAEEYRRKILQTVASEKFPAERVFDLFAKTLVRAGLYGDIHAAHCSEMQIGALRFALSGYAYDPQSCVLSLFLLDWGPYVRSDSPVTLRNTDVNRLTLRLLNFYHLASHNRLINKGLDAQTDAGKAASDIFGWSASETGTRIKKLNCVTLTLRSDKTENKDLLEEFQYGGNRLSCVRLVYDYRSLYELSHSADGGVIDLDKSDVPSGHASDARRADALVVEAGSDAPDFAGQPEPKQSPEKPTAVADELTVSRFYRPQTEEKTLDVQVNSAEEYRRKILQTDSSTGLQAYRIFELFAKTLVRAGLYEDIRSAHCNARQVGNLKIALSGYAYDPQACIVTLFLLDWGTYVCSDSPEPLRTADFDRLTKRLLNFYGLAARNRLIDEVLDAQTDEGQAAGDIFRWSALEDENKVNQVRCVVLTLRPDKTGKKELAEEFPFGEDGPSCVRLVYDYRSLYELSHSAAEVVINFEDPKSGFEPVDMIEAFNRQDGYRAYLGRMPAVNLARIYAQYGQRVLNGNVRAFLQSNNRVNKGMLKTAREDAESFFAYNNGICVVAREMDTLRHGTVDRIVSVRDFQIVNGGQTTATLHKLWNDYRRKTKSEPEAENVLKNVYVPMKLTVPSPTCSDEQREALIMNISKFANSQSAVSNADLGANTHFQIKFKSQSEHSRCAIRPSVGGSGTVTYWYYERSRGSYKVESDRDEAILTKRKKKGKTPFELRYPKKFTKTDLAKWIKSWDQVPHIVSRGSQKCYAAFEADVRNAEKQDPSLSFVTPEYVQYCIGKGILFRQVDSVVAGTSWYKAAKSYKANLVCYAVAYLSLTLQRLYGKEAELDFFRIWDKQATPTNLAQIVERMARLALETFNWKDRGWDDVGEWVKKKECWEKMSEHVMEFSDGEKRLLREWTVRRIPEYTWGVETNSIEETDPE